MLGFSFQQLELRMKKWVQVSPLPDHLQVGVKDEELGEAVGEDHHACPVDNLVVHEEGVAEVLLLALLLNHEEPVAWSPGVVA